VNGGATLTCIVQFVFDDGMAVTLDAVWKRNGFIIDSLTPHHELIKNSMIPPRIVGVLVKDFEEYDDGTEYTCTVNYAPDYFNSSHYLFVSGMDVCTICDNILSHIFCTTDRVPTSLGSENDFIVWNSHCYIRSN